MARATRLAAAFSAFIRFAYRGRRLADISALRFGFVGGIATGIFIPIFMQSMNILSGDGPVPWEQIDGDAVLLGLFGGVAAGVSLKLAQLASRFVPEAARHIQESIAAPFTLDGRQIVATVSIGAALSEAGHGQPQDLLHHADLAMYHAKRQGRARFQLFDAALRDSAQARIAIETDLRNAVDQRQLRLVFQPIVELETGRVRSLEALLRWHRPRREAVTPLDIVAVAERTGLILPIGRWVLREACRNARAWLDASPAAAKKQTRVSVNLSAKQFWDPGLMEEVRTAVRDSGVDPSILVLEIPERVLMANVEASRSVLQRLRELGVGVHIDDFGTSSSLIHLSRFPVQGIKLERALVHHMGARRTEHFAIVRSIMDLARSLGLEISAEGVETIAQRERLIALGCELGQGYLFAKPLEPKAAGALLAQAA